MTLDEAACRLKNQGCTVQVAQYDSDGIIARDPNGNYLYMGESRHAAVSPDASGDAAMTASESPDAVTIRVVGESYGTNNVEMMVNALDMFSEFDEEYAEIMLDDTFFDEEPDWRSCMDCGERHQLEYYMLGNKLWARITRAHERHGELCLACVETRLGRPLKPRDFLFTPLEMKVRLSLPAGALQAWDAVLGRRRTRHRLFDELAAGATSVEQIGQRIIDCGGRASAADTRDRMSPAAPDLS